MHLMLLGTHPKSSFCMSWVRQQPKASFQSKIIINVVVFHSFFILKPAFTPNVFPVPPSIEDGPSEEVATVNNQARLMCEVLGLPQPTVTWTKDGQDIPQSSNNYRMQR